MVSSNLLVLISVIDYNIKNICKVGVIMKIKTKEKVAGWLLASPWILGFLFFTAGPMLYSLFLSFTNYDLFNRPEWIGFANYNRIFTGDYLVPQALKVTFIFTLTSVPLNLILGLLIALLLNQKIKMLSFFRTVYYLPSVIPYIATLFMWMLVFNPAFGLFNSVLKLVNINGPNWLGDPDWALPSLVIISLWGVGRSMLVYLAGLQGVPTELYESAKIDGANAWQSFWKITIPMISPVIFFNLIMGIITSLQAFNTAYIMTQGGPVNSTYFFMLHIFYNAFEDYNMGYSSALAWILFIITFVFTLIVFKSVGSKIYYGEEG
ncbi:MAG: multiple sugar transport system permease protein [Candidatus Frackibacter sp. T328-2]|nr:MAG: multiple sugar transport system permease protein [Candidatus Frackibacter sp. T328-2]